MDDTGSNLTPKAKALLERYRKRVSEEEEAKEDECSDVIIRYREGLLKVLRGAERLREVAAVYLKKEDGR